MLPMPPIEWPRVTIRGENLEVKHGPRVTYRASKLGIDIRHLAQHAYTFATHLDLFGVMVAPHYEALGQPVPTGEDWAEIVMREDQPALKFSEIAEAVRGAILLDAKTRPATKTPPTQEPANMGNAPS